MPDRGTAPRSARCSGLCTGPLRGLAGICSNMDMPRHRGRWCWLRWRWLTNSQPAISPRCLAAGATAVAYDVATRSVGFPGLLGRERTAMLQTAEVLSEAKQEGALVMATACPLSHFNLDVYQVKAKKVSGRDTALPVVHLPELMAFALGLLTERYAQLRTRALVMGA